MSKKNLATCCVNSQKKMIVPKYWDNKFYLRDHFLARKLEFAMNKSNLRTNMECLHFYNTTIYIFWDTKRCVPSGSKFFEAPWKTNIWWIPV